MPGPDPFWLRPAVVELELALPMARDPGAARSWARLVASDLAPSSERRLIVAQVLFGLGDVEPALELLDTLVSAAAGTVTQQAVEQRFRYRTLLGRFHEALAELSAHTLSAPLCARVADVLLRRDNPQRALPFLERGLMLQPGAATLRMARADALAQLGAWEASGAALREAVVASGHRPEYVAAAARLALGIGAFDDAEALARSLLERDLQAPTAHDVLGHLALFRGAPGEAMDHATALLAVDLPSGLLLRGAARSLVGDDAGAEPDLQAAAADRDLWEAQVWLGEVLLRRGDHRAAVELFRSASEAAPGLLVSAHLLRLLATCRTFTAKTGWLVGGFASYGEVVDAIRTLCPDADTALASDDARLIVPLYERALARMRGNRTLSASVVDDGVLVPLRARPGPRFQARRVMNLVATSPTDEVLTGLARVVADHPQSGVPRCYRAELHLWLGEYRVARAELEQVIAEFPRTRWAYIGLATVEMLEGHHEPALETLARGIAAMNNTMGPPAYAVRGEILRRLGRLPKAIADLEKACELSPRRAAAWINLALAYAASGRAADASRVFERVRPPAMPLIDDAFAAMGLDIHSPTELATGLEHALTLMQGNRSSSGVSWMVPGRPLRFLFFETSAASTGLAAAQERELDLARASFTKRA